MGYKISLNINCQKAVDFADLAGVSLLVYLEGESFSIMTLTSDEHGWAFDTLDRSHYAQSTVGRIKVYYSKSGYVSGCVLAVNQGDFVDPNSVKNYSFQVTPLLVEAEPEELPPPTVLPATP